MSSNIDLFNQSWLNTIFEGRNKSYGAYELRTTETKTNLRALIIGSLLFIGIVSYPLIANILENLKGDDEEVVTKVELQKLNQPKKKDEKKDEILEEKKPVEEKKTQTVSDIQKFVPPVIVNKETVEEELAATDDLKNKNVGTQTMEGNAGGELVLDNTASEEKSQEGEVIDYNQVFTSVEVNPEPPGGINSFRTKVQNGLLGSLGDIEESINGSVRIRFVVMEDGSLGNFEVLEESPKGFKLADKAIQQIKKSPKWKAGVMNGRNVKVYYSFPLKFQISAGE